MMLRLKVTRRWELEKISVRSVRLCGFVAPLSVWVLASIFRDVSCLKIHFHMIKLTHLTAALLFIHSTTL